MFCRIGGGDDGVCDRDDGLIPRWLAMKEEMENGGRSGAEQLEVAVVAVDALCPVQ